MDGVGCAIPIEEAWLGGGNGGKEASVDDGGPDGHWKALPVVPERSMSRIKVSMGVLPTRRTKNSCSMTADETVRRDGSRRSNLPKRVGWFG